MANKGKGTEVPNKAALKKAKRATKKARHDRAGAFAAKSRKGVFDIDIDAVDKSPIQIPKKSVMIPALSLVLQSSPTKT